MSKRYKRQAYLGMLGDMKNLEYHFARMALQGWMIDKIGLFTHRYRAAEPCEKRFFVDFLPQITAFDYPNNEDAQEYRAICEASGWHFVAANKQFHVFCADGENPEPIPIHTDNGIQAKIFLKACRKYELPWFAFALLMCWLSSPFGKGIELFLSNISLFMAIGYAFFYVGFLWHFGFMLRWYWRTRKAAKHSRPMPAVHYKWARMRNDVFVAGTVLFVACTAAGLVLEILGGMPMVVLLAFLTPLLGVATGFWIRRQVDTKRRTRAGNIALTIVAVVVMELVLLGGMGFIAYRIMSSPASESDTLGERPALVLSDVGVTAEPGYTDTRVKGTPAFPVDYNHRESGGGGSVFTQAYRSVSQTLANWLYDHLADEFYEQFADRLNDGIGESWVVMSPEEAALWGADEGVAFHYANSNAVEILLRRDKTLLRIGAGGDDINEKTIHEAVRRLWDVIR